MNGRLPRGTADLFEARLAGAPDPYATVSRNAAERVAGALTDFVAAHPTAEEQRVEATADRPGAAAAQVLWKAASCLDLVAWMDGNRAAVDAAAKAIERTGADPAAAWRLLTHGLLLGNRERRRQPHGQRGRKRT